MCVQTNINEAVVRAPNSDLCSSTDLLIIQQIYNYTKFTVLTINKCILVFVYIFNTL
jgi:hypothetical protein